MPSKRQKALDSIEDFWVKHSILLCFFLGLAAGVVHFFEYIQNVREMAGDAINFSSIVIGVTGVFLTLIVTLQESPVFERLRKFFPSVQITLYKTLQKQIYYGLLLVIMSVLIKSLPASPYKILSSIGVSIWFTLFWLVSLGAFYTIKLVTDLVVKNFDLPTTNKRM